MFTVSKGQWKQKNLSSTLQFYVSFFPNSLQVQLFCEQELFRDLENRLIVNLEVIRFSFAQILLGFTKKVVLQIIFAIVVDRVLQITLL